MLFMQQANIRDGQGTFFKVLQTSRNSQTAIMTLAPGKSSGPKRNEHPKSEQTLLVLEGEILADIGSQKTTLRKGDVVTVPPGAEHRFTNYGGSPAVTFNVYAPPAYDANEEE